MYKISVQVCLEPVNLPEIAVSCEGTVRQLRLNQPTWVGFEFVRDTGDSNLIVELKNKADTDPDTAVIIKDIRFNGIQSDRILYEGLLHYSNETKRDTYLDRNGFWKIDFTLPIYTWLHKTQGLGWIYD